MADQEKPQEPAAGATGRLAEEDRHGFVSAFVGGVRSDGDQGRSGKRVVAVGIAVVAAVGLGAVAVGALTGGDDTKKKDVAGKLSPAAATSQADRHGKGQEDSQGSVSHGGNPGTNGGGSADGTGGAGGDSGNHTVADGHREAPSDDGHKGSASSAPTSGSGSGSGSGSAKTTSSSNSTGSAHAPTVSKFAAAPAYTALAGYGCPSSGSANVWTKDPNFNHGSSGWLKSSSGGYAGSGCNGQYISIPMSGSSSSHDSTQYVLWKFDYSSKIKGTASCNLAVYIPNNNDIQHVGGAPAQYALYNSDHSGGKTAGSFDISQVGNRGNWVTKGPFRVSGGKLTLKLFNTGVDYTSSTKHAHDAAAPVRLSCNSA
ncbi:hypothetical protein AB0I22_23625 [Streptomyces sp. NPDC050610]|uniref:hypothetical protein n=1 Tax=Streptomyces sp. NPDC050610 TaxID=3157097 RepID=UPI0034142E31